ncbi:MAG: aminoacyl-tRNA hydrolase [Planctomycetota bacterium]
MSEAGARLVLGLGNPGREYDGTRHNVGFEVTDRLAQRLALSFRRSGRALLAQVPGAVPPRVLAKPQTFMNLSGRAARELVEEFGASTQVLVLCDDYHLPLGRLRCRASGSAGGQKGLASVIAAFPEREIPRLRLGIGAPAAGRPTEDYVLARFTRSEQAEATAMLDRAAEYVQGWLENGELPLLIQRANAL